MMTTLKQLLAVAIGLFAVFQAPQSVAAPVTISAGQAAIFNFDYSGYTPAPPYSYMSINWNMSGLSGYGEGDKGIVRSFSGLNGSGDMLTDGGWEGAIYTSGIGSPDSRFTDGIFSIVFESILGTATIGSFQDSYMRTEADQYVYYEGDPDVVITGGNDVPEPASLLLLGSGLLALIAMRRKAGKSI
ncbi:MAG: PEP-CTERM sorting domain-containing protein [Propionivibrio sp.]|nr:PEP-CTERM sorting domain-containing protein [Propionivibrio sp.]